MSPGENAATRVNRSPLIRPNVSEYEAPSEKPATPMRDGSTLTRSKAQLRAFVMY
jgi:hypothetical protein